MTNTNINVNIDRAIYRIGWELEDVSATARADFTIDCGPGTGPGSGSGSGNMRIEGRDGEPLSIPRYVARILESEKTGDGGDGADGRDGGGYIASRDDESDSMITALKQAISKERMSDDLTKLEPDFYIRLEAALQGLESDLDRERAGDLRLQLFRRRHGKILRGVADVADMTVEERGYRADIVAAEAKLEGLVS